MRNYAYPPGDSGEALIPDFIARAHHRNVKVLLSIQGSAQGQFVPVARDDRKRALFARVMAAFVRKYGYDGIEIDWEHTIDIVQHARLMADLRHALSAAAEAEGRGPQTYYLTTALNTCHAYPPELAQRLCSSVDWVNLMTYDMGGGNWGSVPLHNTPLDKMQEAMTKWAVFPPHKICIGLANYGYRYKGLFPGQKSETSLKVNGRSISFKELQTLVESGWTESYAAAAEAPYYFSPDKTEFVTIDSERSLSRKMEWVFQMKYRGVFWWEFHHDYFPPDSDHTQARHPLIDSVSNAIFDFGQKHAR